MTPRKGNPQILVRVDAKTLAAAQAVYPSVKGRSGGVALALRRLLYVILDQPIPKQYGEVRRSKEIDELEELVRALELGEPTERDLLTEVREILEMTEDPVDKLRLQSVAGRVVFLEG